MRIGYADPPYPGMSGYYRHHADYGGEVDHGALVRDLDQFDGWVLHTASTTLAHVLELVAREGVRTPRIGAWVKPFASWKPSQRIAYAWEPVLFVPARSQPDRSIATVRDYVAVPITLQRGLMGVKPDAVCRWAFDIVGADPEDELHDLFPGSGAVSRAWDAWSRQLSIGEA